MSAEIIQFGKPAQRSKRCRRSENKRKREKFLSEWYRANGPRLKVARESLGLSENEAAAEFAVALHTYRKWEAGGVCRNDRYYLGLRTFIKKYHVSEWWLRWLLGGDGAPPRFKLRLVS
jgi:ribosome-binding protein aMBF1 (putative translation factor)